MIYLRTGANGAGKTLLTLRDVQEKSLKESRPVYHNGRFAPVPDGPLKNWKQIDIKDWESVPDGAIFVVDEAHNDFPVRAGNQPVPGYVKALAEHRRRGFDFYLITQHPLNIDTFVRRLIGAPGWHQHLKRASGAPLVSVIEWPSVNEQCQRAGAGESGQVNMVSYPKEVYDWYTSTSLDTAKVKVPFRVWVVLAGVVAVPLLVWAAVAAFQKTTAVREAQNKGIAAAESAVSAAPGGRGGAASEPLTAAQYVASFQPRLPGLSFTAPRYDKLTEPTDAPFPAACMATASRCECYTQQATRLPVPDETCRQIVAGGYFKDWGNSPGAVAPVGLASPASPARSSVTLQSVDTVAAVSENDGAVLASMRSRYR